MKIAAFNIQKFGRNKVSDPDVLNILTKVTNTHQHTHTYAHIHTRTRTNTHTQLFKCVLFSWKVFFWFRISFCQQNFSCIHTVSYPDVTLMSPWCHTDVTLMSHWCNPDVTLMSRWCHPDVTLMSRWCHTDVTLMSPWCNPDVTLMSRWCHADVTLMSHWCHTDVTLMSPWCHPDVTLMSRWCHTDVTLMSHWCHADVTLMSHWCHADVTLSVLSPDCVSIWHHCDPGGGGRQRKVCRNLPGGAQQVSFCLYLLCCCRRQEVCSLVLLFSIMYFNVWEINKNKQVRQMLWLFTQNHKHLPPAGVRGKCVRVKSCFEFDFLSI